VHAVEIFAIELARQAGAHVTNPASAPGGDIAPTTLEEANRGYRDTPSEADVDVRTTRALAGMVDAVI
jgi:hypothetical protein